MSLLGRIYVLVAVILFVVLSSWALWTLRENANLVEVVMLVPQLRGGDFVAQKAVDLSVGALLLGWLVAGASLLLIAARAPYRIRAAASRLRRIRELEKEVQTLRVLPLRQQEEDELLAQEARLDLHERRVMISQIESETENFVDPSQENSAAPVSWAHAKHKSEADAPQGPSFGEESS